MADRLRHKAWGVFAVMTAISVVVLATALAANGEPAADKAYPSTIRVNPVARVITPPHATTRRAFAAHLTFHRLTHHVMTATISSVRFPSTGGTFVVRVRNIPAQSLCALAGGNGVIFRGTYRCAGRLFAHKGRVRVNNATATKRWSVRMTVRTAGVRRNFHWVVVVGAKVPTPTTTTTTTTTPTPATTTTTTTTPAPTPTTLPPLPAPTTPTPPPTTTLPPPPTPQPGSQSTNWSGYFVQTPAGGTTDVQGTWTVPTLNCAGTPNGHAAQWIGVDGESNSNLFQTGTESTCASGVQSNEAWVEELPAAADNFQSVATGDTIIAHIWQVSSGEWQFTLDDVTAGWQETLLQPTAYSGPGTSAEWINEDPTDASTNTLFPFADFGTVTFSNISFDGSLPNLSLSTNGIEMVQNGSVLALPSAPSSGGFSVAYE